MLDQKCQEEYVRRIHKVQDYIEKHIGQSLTIEELANAAGFSKYHFSRIFQGMLHESLAHYVNRIRMENALFLLAHRSDKNITDIAYELGLSDSATFSRAFKNYYGVSPSEYRKEYRRNYKDVILLSEYNMKAVKKEGKGDPFPVTGQITIEHREAKQVVYVRHSGTYETLAKEYVNLMQTLFDYAKIQQLLLPGQSRMLVMYHDNPEFGEASQFRTSLCLTVPQDIRIQEDGVLGRMKVEGGLYAVGHFIINQEQYSDAWNYMYQEWITGSGYVPRNYAPFEAYRIDSYGDESADENFIHEVEIFVPIEPM